MIVYVEGSTKVKRDHILESSFFYEKMLYKRRLPSLKIDIELEKDLEKTEKILGDCLWEDRRKKPRYFTIRIDGGVTLPRMLRALAHELVHVKQYSTGEMVDCRVDLDKVYWLDEEWKPSKHDYKNQYGHITIPIPILEKKLKI